MEHLYSVIYGNIVACSGLHKIASELTDSVSVLEIIELTRTIPNNMICLLISCMTSECDLVKNVCL